MAKTLLVVRLVTHKLIESVDAVVGVELLATTLAGKHLTTVLPNFVVVRHLQRLESFVTDITGMNPLSLLCFVSPQGSHPATKLFPSQTCPRQQMSTPLHVLLKADPRLEGDVADDKADPLVCLQLNQISVLQYFLETAG